MRSRSLTLGLVLNLEDLALGVGGVGAVGALKVHLLLGELGLAVDSRWRPVLLPGLRLDLKDLALGVGSVGTIGALEIHLLLGELDLADDVRWGPVLLPGLRLDLGWGHDEWCELIRKGRYCCE